MPNTFTFGSVTSRTFGVYISGSGAFNAPARDYEYIEVPGRSGDLVINNKRLRNIDLVYPAFITSSLSSNISGLESALLSQIGYQRLTDSYHTSEFRLATFEGPLDVTPIKKLSAGEFEILFRCKPQRFLTSGESTTTLTSTGSISNPTLFDSKPQIVVTGYGELGVGGQTITISNQYTSVTIDSDIGDCYSGSDNANPYVTFSDDQFPVLKPGSNAITLDATITKVVITPRWWTL